MRIVDDTARLLRAPEVRFEAARSGSRPSATTSRTATCWPRWPRARGNSRRSRRSRRRPRPSRSTTIASRSGCRQGHAVSARLAIGADGRRSLCRPLPASRSTHRSYPQIRADLQSRPHPPAPTTPRPNSTPKPARSPWCRCPGSGRAWCSWSIRTKRRALPRFPTRDLSQEIERRSHSILGKVTVEPGRGMFPLADRDRAALRRAAGGAGRRSRPRDPADRRAGPQSRPARRRHRRRTRGCRPPRWPRCGRRTI